jgi:hypothetical protein
VTGKVWESQQPSSFMSRLSLESLWFPYSGFAAYGSPRLDFLLDQNLEMVLISHNCDRRLLTVLKITEEQ